MSAGVWTDHFAQLFIENYYSHMEGKQIVETPGIEQTTYCTFIAEQLSLFQVSVINVSFLPELELFLRLTYRAHTQHLHP